MTSASFRDRLFSDANGEPIVLLLTITHPQLAEDILLSSDNKDLLDFEEQQYGTISRAKEFAFLPMTITLPEQGDEVQPVLSVTLFDVAAQVTPLLESTVTPAYVTAEVVSAEAPDAVEVEFAIFELRDADIAGDTVTLQLVVDGMGDEPFPADSFTPSGFPGLWTTY